MACKVAELLAGVPELVVLMRWLSLFRPQMTFSKGRKGEIRRKKDYFPIGERFRADERGCDRRDLSDDRHELAGGRSERASDRRERAGDRREGPIDLDR